MRNSIVSVPDHCPFIYVYVTVNELSELFQKKDIVVVFFSLRKCLYLAE